MLEVVAFTSRTPRSMPHALRRGLSVLVCVGALALAGRSQAQSCHTVPSLRETSGLTYRVGLTSILGSFQSAAVSGEYQGLLLSAAVSHPWFSAEIALPGYRIAKTGSHDYGLGDLGADVRGNLYRSDDGSVIVGPELGMTLPTGSSNEDLAMQHPMIAPGGFVFWQQSGWNLLAQVGYGRALAGAHAHHMGPMPLVSPMNRSELTHAIGASAKLHANLRATGRLLGAINVFDHNGAPREVIAPGLQLVLGAFDASVELQLPVVGKPFTSRTLLSVGAQW
jgi:hypothetical protein